MSFFSPPKEFIVHETEYWSVSHRITTCLPGYLMVTIKTCGISDFEAFSLEAKQELGVVLANSEESVKKLFKPDRVYISRYGHTPDCLMHFHVIPVYSWVEDLFLRDERYRVLERFNYGDDNSSDGAVLTLYIWREFCENPSPPVVPDISVDQAVKMLKSHFERSSLAGIDIDGVP